MYWYIFAVPLSSSSSSQPCTLCDGNSYSEHMLNYIRDIGAPDPPLKDQLAVMCELDSVIGPISKADPIMTDLSMLEVSVPWSRGTVM